MNTLEIAKLEARFFELKKMAKQELYDIGIGLGVDFRPFKPMFGKVETPTKYEKIWTILAYEARRRTDEDGKTKSEVSR